MIRKHIKLFILGLVSFIFFLGLTVYSSCRISGQSEQGMAKRWSSKGGYAQISCYFDASAGVNENTIRYFRNSLNNTLEQESIIAPTESARLYIDAYSGIASIYIQGNKGSGSFQTVGVGGDFFRFHELDLLYGDYFDTDGLMKDYILIDKETAWQLFGSVNVVGMQVTIGGKTYRVSGVIERDKDKYAKAGGLEAKTVYMPYSEMELNGNISSIMTYEIVMQNPISNYAKDKVKSGLSVSEENVDVIENSKRFTIVPLLHVLKTLAVRSMKTSTIVYPYWENEARAVENILAVILLFRIIFLLIPTVLLVILIVHLWRHKKWGKKEVKDLLEKLLHFLKQLILRPFRKRIQKDNEE